jgi:hypothetical protein
MPTRPRDLPPGSRYGWLLWDILVPLAVTRFILTAIGFLCANSMPLSPDSKFSYTGILGHNWLMAWSRWDAIWYMRIVKDGYFYTPSEQSSVAFFPLFPALIKLATLVVGGSDMKILFCGVAISNGLLLIALIYLWKLIILDFDQPTAGRAVLYCLVAPSTLFLSAAYPMSLMLALAVAAFYHARRGHWLLAGTIAALAPLARPDGILLAAGLLLEYLYQRRDRLGTIHRELPWPLLLPAITLVGWMLYLHVQFGDSLAFFHTQRNWPASGLGVVRDDWDAMIGMAAAAFSAVLVIAGWRYLQPSYMLYATLMWLLMVTAGRFSSVSRFTLILFPIYIMLALAGRHPLFDRLWLSTSALLAAAMMVRYSLCYFVG